MKVTSVLLGVLLLTLLATSLVQAQTTEKITLYADQAGTDCSISETGVQEVSVYMFHEGAGGRLGVLFRALKPPCWTGATWIRDSIDSWLHMGTSQGQYLAVSYGATAGCGILPIYIGKIVFAVTGVAEACCTLRVIPGVGEQSVITADCNSFNIPIMAGYAVINEDASCPCSPPLAVDTVTWGRIKSLYH